jgi:hypothetical protein
MISRNQFNSVYKLLESGVDNYIQIRQQAGLTSDELDDILENLEHYKQKFDEEERLAEIERLRSEKKPWWKRK